MTVVPGGSTGDLHFLIVFVRETVSEPAAEVAAATAALHAPGASDDTAQLQRDLTETRAYLRNLTEEYEAHSEELRAANEEIRSANEELQSTNEELSTTKEELQSTNEELTTVNEELQTRNDQLSALNDDLKNLLGTVNIPIIVVDNEFRIRRFTAAAENLLGLSAIDIGHLLVQARGAFPAAKMDELARRTLDTLQVEPEEMQGPDGKWYSVEVRPFRTQDNRIAGALIAFFDIDPLKRSLQAAEQARDYAESLIGTVREPLVVLDADLKIRRATNSFYETFQVSREETEGRYLYSIGNGQWNVPRLRELITEALFRDIHFQDFELEHVFPHIGKRTVRLNGRRIALMDGLAPHVAAGD